MGGIRINPDDFQFLKDRLFSVIKSGPGLRQFMEHAKKNEEIYRIFEQIDEQAYRAILFSYLRDLIEYSYNKRKEMKLFKKLIPLFQDTSVTVYPMYLLTGDATLEDFVGIRVRYLKYYREGFQKVADRFLSKSFGDKIRELRWMDEDDIVQIIVIAKQFGMVKLFNFILNLGYSQYLEEEELESYKNKLDIESNFYPAPQTDDLEDF